MPSNPKIDALMYIGALAAGVLLTISGKATTVEATGYISPFLVMFERGKRSTSEQ